MLATLAVTMVAGAESVEARRINPYAKVTKAKIKLHWEAMQALYGAGLKIQRSKHRTTIAPQRGGLTQAKFNQYVQQVYLPALKEYTYYRKGPGFRFGSQELYKHPRFDTHARIKLAVILLEPYAKFKLCRQINAALGDLPNIIVAHRRQSWCAYQAMLESIAPIFEYRGTKVTWKGRRDKGDLKVTHVIFRKNARGDYPIIVTVAGGGKWYTRDGINILYDVAKQVDATFAKGLRRRADKLTKRARKAYQKLMKQVARDQRKLMRGKRIIFAGQRFYSQILTRPATGPLPCKQTYFFVVGPKRKRRQGYHLGVEVNGVECQAYPLSALEEYRGDIIGQNCDRHLQDGENKITVAVHNSLNSFNYKRKEWRQRETGRGLARRSITYTKTRRGKRLYSRRITCKR